jgi:pyruvate/2-oxoglutarate dehydrogenase complex dihydrolipoamide acyltransferase (E2) component
MGANGKPVLTGNCQVVQFGKNHTGNDCMCVCQADFSDESYRPVVASFVFNHEGRVIESYFGNSAATPSWETHVNDGTRASFGYLPPPPPPQLQPHQPDSTVLSRIAAINDRLKMFHKSMEKAEIAKLNSDKHYLKVRLDKEAAEAKQAAQATHAAALATHAELLQTPRWGCTSVLKGPLKFVGCQRRDLRDHHSVSLVEGYPYVECVTTSAGFDAKLDTSPQQIVKITPYFKYDPLTGNTMYGASGSQFYDSSTFNNRFGAQGFQSFVVSDPNDGSFRPTETRQGSCPYPNETPVPPTLSALNPATQEEWKRRLRKGNESLRDQMKALDWLETNRLVFPTGPINSAFAHEAFGWVRELSIQFQPNRLSLSSAAMAKMLASRIHASPAAIHSPAMRAELFKGLTVPPIGARHINRCDCTPMNHNPRCLNHLCPFKHTRLARLPFEWPLFECFESDDPEARTALESEILGAAAAASAAATAKQQAAEAAEEKRRAADAKRDARNALAKAATEQKRLAAASAKASAASASAGPATAASASAASASAASASPAVASRKRKTSEAQASAAPASAAPASAAPASAAPASAASRKKRKGGAKSKSKSKSKRRLRK